MNIENLNKAIAIMERAGKVNMNKWQHGQIVETEKELNICGTAACFAGWIAVSPEWKADGGTVGFSGAPAKDHILGRHAIADWLEIPYELAGSIVFGDTLLSPETSRPFSVFYNKPWCNVGKVDVLNKLNEIKEKGLVQVLKNYIEFLSTFEKFEESTSNFAQQEYTRVYKECLAATVVNFGKALN